MKKTVFTFYFVIFAALSQLFASTSENIITLDLSNPLNPASFTYVADKGNWTETYNDEDYTYIDFNVFSFSHLIAGSGASFGGYYWDGFTVCSSGDNTDYGETGDSQGWVANQWGCMAGGGIKTDTEGNILKDENGKVITEQGIPYLLAYWGYYMEASGIHCLQTIFNDGKSYYAVGMYVNNSPWPYFGNNHGDGFARALDQEGDYFKLIIHGLDENYTDNGNSVDHYLAKFENGKLTQSPDWEWVDLSSLGEISGLYYTMETTDADPTYGPNTAVYFCMDKLQVKEIKNTTEQSTLFNKSELSVYPNPFTNYINIKTDKSQTIKIFNTSGQCVINKKVSLGESTIDVQSLQKGVYVLQSDNKTMTLIKK